MIRKVDSFQHRLKIALDDAKISQSELGRRTGINRQLISDYLKGKYEAKQDKLYELAKVLNVDEGWLMGVSDKKERRHPEEDFEITNRENGDITDKDIDYYFNGLRSYKGLEISDEQKEFMRNSIKSFLESQRAMHNKQNKKK